MNSEITTAATPDEASFRGITDADLTWWVDKIPTLDWVFATTYADGAPHEYISERTAGMSKTDFERAARVVHTFGGPQKFYKSTRIYFAHDGWKYWTMDDDHREVALINRGREDHVYGVQNAPTTRSEVKTAYDRLATHWDTAFGLSSDERDSFAAIVDEVTGGYRKCRTLDLGAGTGVALDIELTDAFRLTAVDPSGPMLNDLVRKHPLVARVEPMTFAAARARKVLGSTKFDLVLALGGSGSYLTPDDWSALPTHGKGRFVIAVYAEGESPLTADLTTAELSKARERAHEFAEYRGGHVTRVGRFDVSVVRA